MASSLRGAALAAIFLLPTAAAQASTPNDDWDSVLRTAIEHRRFAVRRAASGRLARAGDVAVPAVRRWIESNGVNSIPLTVVASMITTDTQGELTIALLDSWARDRDFFWRSHALDALASRSSKAHRQLFLDALTDPSHLFRMAGAKGLMALGVEADREEVRKLLGDPDPRVPHRAALLLLEAGDPSGVSQLLSAVAQPDRKFLDNAWGAREAQTVVRKLRSLGEGDFTEALSKNPTERTIELGNMTTWALKLDPNARATREPQPEPEWVGGLEIRSCRNGDLHVRWTAEGEIGVGLAPDDTFDAATLVEHLNSLESITGKIVHGRVVCDFVRVRGIEVDQKAAPGALPENVSDWLKQLASVFEESEEQASAESIRRRLRQFDQN